MKISSIVLLTIGSILLLGCSYIEFTDIPEKKNIAEDQSTPRSNAMQEKQIVSPRTDDNKNLFTSKMLVEVEKILNAEMNIDESQDIFREFQKRGDNVSEDDLFLSIEEKIEKEDWALFSINPFKKELGNDSCRGYGYSSCYNFVVDNSSSKIVFSDIDRSSLGLIYDLDSNNDIAYFYISSGEGSDCNGFSQVVHHAVDLETKKVITREKQITSTCPDCNCLSAEEWIETKNIRYIVDKEIVDPDESLDKVFEYIEL